LNKIHLESCKEYLDWYARAFDYLVNSKNLDRQTNFFNGLLSLHPDVSFKYRLAFHAIFWACEIAGTAALLYDDIVDEGQVRRGKPCWHRLNHVGLTAINDGTFLLMMMITWQICQSVNIRVKLIALTDSATDFVHFVS